MPFVARPYRASDVEECAWLYDALLAAAREAGATTMTRLSSMQRDASLIEHLRRLSVRERLELNDASVRAVLALRRARTEQESARTAQNAERS